MLTGCGAEKEPVVASSGVVENSNKESEPVESSEKTENSQAGKETEAQETGSQAEPEKEPEKNPVEEMNNKAMQAYMDFLNGKLKLTTAETFREDETGYYFGLAYGSYDYAELVKGVEEKEIGEGTYTQYAFVDMGNDGISEMALQLKSARPNFDNWTGIIHFDGEKLKLNYSYTDGYRSEATLYKNGALNISGSAGAGAHVVILYDFDKEGFGKEKATLYDYFGLFATNVIYDLPAENYDVLDYDNDFWMESQISLTEYKENDIVKICVTDWNENADVRAKEEELVQKLKDFGAVEISVEEMDSLWKSLNTTEEEVEWKDFFSEDCETDIYVDLEEGMYFPYIDTVEYNTENKDLPVVRVFPKRTITDVKVLELSFVDIDEAGVATFSAEEKYCVDSLKRGQDFMIGTAFAGDIPNNGISFVDVNGKTHAYSFGISGMDGSLVMSPIVIQ